MLVVCKKSNFSFLEWACLLIATAIIESFNTVPWALALLEYTDTSATMGNGALYDDRCRIKRTVHQSEPLARADQFSLTGSLLFVGTMLVDVEAQSNFVPCPRIHFMLCGHTLIISPTRCLMRHSDTVPKSVNAVMARKTKRDTHSPREGGLGS